MLNESLLSLSFEELKDFLLHELSIFDVALGYVLVYVVYKALGRYIYFKPQEHASKINRTFLVLSLIAIAIHFLSNITNTLPFLPEYRWLFAISSIALFIAPFSMLMFRVIWKYDKYGEKTNRYWKHMPINNDYYKTTVSKSTQNGMSISNWEEEGVESTSKNLHSDALLDLCCLVIFIAVGTTWSFESATQFGWYSVAFFSVISLWIAGIFLDRSIFSWIKYLEERIRFFARKKT